MRPMKPAPDLNQNEEWRAVKRDMTSQAKRSPGRRGVTLVEMLVTLAILLFIMTAIVQVFQAATGSLSSAQAYQELDSQLRQIESTIRGDLSGVTARFTPPLNPKDNLGYFEYIENSFADLQGEDSDDCLRFTAKAPPGKPFVGRLLIPPFIPIANMSAAQLQYYLSTQPITITSDYAEIIYFLRNGNLYRRVLLIAPERQSSINQAHSNTLVSNLSSHPNSANQPFQSASLGTNLVSWQGLNDLSAHPSGTGGVGIVLNTLGDLTNRENRFASPRFANDFIVNSTGLIGHDGIADDANADGIPDFYPTLYYNILPANAPANPLIFASNYTAPAHASYATMAFPFIFPGAYTTPETIGFGEGRIHTPTPQVYDPVNNTGITYVGNPLAYLRGMNHNPLDSGDNLPVPPTTTTGYTQTWWGFPTWRETLSPNWVDPTYQVNVNIAQPLQLNPIDPDTAFPAIDTFFSAQLLPPMTLNYRATPQLWTDGAPSKTLSAIVAGNGVPLWPISWEDDLIMTGVRSFDVKVYDNTLANYADLGWGDDIRLASTVLGWTGVGPENPPYPMPNFPPFLQGNYDFALGNYRFDGGPVHLYVNGGYVDLFQSFAHEGRMPPLINDNRFDAQFGAAFYPGYVYTGNIGDNTAGIQRLRRVWDSWSTDYTNAPANGIDSAQAGNNLPAGMSWGPPFQPPIYPSYPPPYPAPLLGIQIQIRVTDPTNQRIKSLTIRQDFTDKL
jgi:prepilin-type N-terminal cleavage/methylation domain-containing protein